MPFLKHDIKSVLPPKRVYGRAGDKVDIISSDGKVAIVKGPDNFRYPVLLTEIDEVPSDLILDSHPALPVSKAKPTSAAVTRPKQFQGPAPPNQPSLF